MKVSVSLPEGDIALLDTIARETDRGSRSAVLQHAVELLREERLKADYAAAADEWEESGEAAVWEGTSSDGLHA